MRVAFPPVAEADTLNTGAMTTPGAAHDAAVAGTRGRADDHVLVPIFGAPLSASATHPAASAPTAALATRDAYVEILPRRLASWRRSCIGRSRSIFPWSIAAAARA